MFSREEKKELNSTFFKRFKHHMSKHHSVGGGGGHWEAYKTGVKGIFFRLLTFPEVGLAIDLQFKDDSIRALFHDQFVEFGKLLENSLGEAPEFQPNFILDSGVEVVRISWKLEGAYFYDQKQWLEIMNWYETKLLGLDEFWEMAGDVIKALAR